MPAWCRSDRVDRANHTACMRRKLQLRRAWQAVEASGGMGRCTTWAKERLLADWRQRWGSWMSAPRENSVVGWLSSFKARKGRVSMGKTEERSVGTGARGAAKRLATWSQELVRAGVQALRTAGVQPPQCHQAGRVLGRGPGATGRCRQLACRPRCRRAALQECTEAPRVAAAAAPGGEVLGDTACQTCRLVQRLR